MALRQLENAMAIVPSQFPNEHVPLEAGIFNFERDISHHVDPAILNNIHSILAKCRQKHNHVVKKHCLESGVSFSKTSDAFITNTFLPPIALEKALKEGNEESVNLLKKYLPLSAYADQQVIIAQLESRNREENIRVNEVHKQLQIEFIEIMKAQVWNEALESMGSEYYYLFLDYGNTESKLIPFYNQERMKAFVAKMKEKYSRDFASKLEKLGITSSNPHFITLITSIAKAGANMLVRNKKHEENCRHNVKNFIHTEYKLEGCSKLEQVLNNDPFSFSNEEQIKQRIVDELHMKYLKEIDDLSKVACLENPEEFRRSYVAELEAMSGKMVKYGMTLLKDVQDRLDNFYKSIQSEFSEVVKRSCKVNQLPDSVRVNVQQIFVENVINECKKDGFSSKFARTAPAPSSDNTQVQAVLPGLTELTQEESITDCSTIQVRVATIPPMQKSSRPIESSEDVGTANKRSKVVNESSLPLTPVAAPRTELSVNSNAPTIVWHPNGNSKQNQQGSARRGSRWNNGS